MYWGNKTSRNPIYRFFVMSLLDDLRALSGLTTTTVDLALVTELISNAEMGMYHHTKSWIDSPKITLVSHLDRLSASAAVTDLRLATETIRTKVVWDQYPRPIETEEEDMLQESETKMIDLW